ncbi:MAG: choice-of-anchor tandem repeat GloVer-containing protein [Limisphaerales bacterium]
MKMTVKNQFLQAALIVALGLISVSPLAAQTFTNLHSFSGGNNGSEPAAGLVLSGNTLYGTATSSTIFAINTNGTGFTILYPFTNVNDGVEPEAGLILSGSTLYGTTRNGGNNNLGVVFAISTNGTGYTNVYSLGNGSDGSIPMAGLILSGNTLYGTTEYGGSARAGTLFAVNTDGTGYTNVYTFGNGSDGSNPQAGVILLGNTLYGTAPEGGSAGNGVVFAVNTDGTGYTNLHSFTAQDPNTYTNSDGISPLAGLVSSGNILYGTASEGGSALAGTVFAITTNGSDFSTLYSFTNANDGENPDAGLILSGSTLFGTTANGGSFGDGTVFALNMNGTDFTTLYNFTNGNDGARIFAGVILSENALYGTAYQGGKHHDGAVFGLALPGPPQLSITLSGTDVILTWTNTAYGFTLQSTTSLSPAVWNVVSPASVVISGQNTVTNPISGTQMFYELSQ